MLMKNLLKSWTDFFRFRLDFHPDLVQPLNVCETPLCVVSFLTPVSRVCTLYCTLALVIDLFGGDNFVDDCLEEVVLPRHPG